MNALVVKEREGQAALFVPKAGGIRSWDQQKIVVWIACKGRLGTFGAVFEVLKASPY